MSATTTYAARLTAATEATTKPRAAVATLLAAADHAEAAEVADMIRDLRTAARAAATVLDPAPAVVPPLAARRATYRAVVDMAGRLLDTCEELARDSRADHPAAPVALSLAADALHALEAAVPELDTAARHDMHAADYVGALEDTCWHAERAYRDARADAARADALIRSLRTR